MIIKNILLGISRIINNTESFAKCSTKTMTFISETSKKGKSTGMVLITLVTGREFTKGNGDMVKSTEKGNSPILMGLLIKVNLTMAKKRSRKMINKNEKDRFFD